MMNFREWLLSERKYTTLSSALGNFPVYLNPTIEEIRQCAMSDRSRNARGFADAQGNLYIWPESAGTHESVPKQLGEEIHVAFYISFFTGPRVRVSPFTGITDKKQAQEFLMSCPAFHVITDVSPEPFPLAA